MLVRAVETPVWAAERSLEVRDRTGIVIRLVAFTSLIIAPLAWRLCAMAAQPLTTTPTPMVKARTHANRDSSVSSSSSSTGQPPVFSIECGVAVVTMYKLKGRTRYRRSGFGPYTRLCLAVRRRPTHHTGCRDSRLPPHRLPVAVTRRVQPSAAPRLPPPGPRASASRPLGPSPSAARAPASASRPAWALRFRRPAGALPTHDLCGRGLRPPSRPLPSAFRPPP